MLKDVLFSPVDQSVAVATTNDVQLPSSVSSSGFHSVHSDQSDPSPPHYGQSDHSHYSLSESAPATTGQLYGSYGMDDGIDLEENIRQYYDDPQEYKRKKPAVSAILYYISKIIFGSIGSRVVEYSAGIL